MQFLVLNPLSVGIAVVAITRNMWCLEITTHNSSSKLNVQAVLSVRGLLCRCEEEGLWAIFSKPMMCYYPYFVVVQAPRPLH